MEQLHLIEPEIVSTRGVRWASPLLQKATAQANGLRHSFLEFFAGSGLVAQGLKDHFRNAWANDICDKKAAVYTANHGSKHFYLGSITDVEGAADAAWRSFP